MTNTVHANNLTELRALPAKTLLDFVLKPATDNDRTRFDECVDGYFLPDSVPAIFAAGKQSQVPLLAGWNRDEGSFAVMNESAWQCDRRLYRHGEEGIWRQGAGSYWLYIRQRATTLRGDRWKISPAIGLSHGRPGDGSKHRGRPVIRQCIDIDSILHLLRPRINRQVWEHITRPKFPTCLDRSMWTESHPWRAEDRALSAQMQKFWSNFAKTGNPNGQGVPEWPQYQSAGEWPVMFLNVESKASPDQHRDRYLFLTRVWSKWQRWTARASDSGSLMLLAVSAICCRCGERHRARPRARRGLRSSWREFLLRFPRHVLRATAATPLDVSLSACS